MTGFIHFEYFWGSFMLVLHLFLLPAPNIPLYGNTTFSFIDLSVGGHQGYFHFEGLLWIMLPWTIVYKLVWGDMFSFFLSIYLSVELLGHTATLLFTLEEMSDFFQSSCTNLHSHERWRRVPVSPHSHGCEVVSLWWLPLFLRTFLNVCKKFFRGCSLSAETMSFSHQVGNNV